MKKFELTEETKKVGRVTLYRIKALRSFGNVKAGNLGGFVEKEENLSHEGNSWIYGNAKVCGDARIYRREDYLCFHGLGSFSRNTTFFKCNDGNIRVSCGCFFGDLNEFEAKVKETHGDRKYAKEYLACIEVVKIHFEMN